ncbi:MAG TPA: glycine oxidase ThiO [Pirellulales bacterium]|jgi:glycine oxidase|nr:glycine oxidase ThiO [Pirellulales bacterium]
MPDCLIVGGGVIGLSIAYELAGAGVRVRLVERQAIGREASWAGAGILPPPGQPDPSDAHGQLAALSHALHRAWAEELRSLTGIDNGHRRTGAIYVAHDREQQRSLEAQQVHWRRDRVEHEPLSTGELSRIEPELVRAECAFHLPDECQIRNPWHLRALAAACLLRGVEISEGVQATDFIVRNSRIDGLCTSAGVLRAECYCLTGGCWTAELAAKLDYTLAIAPVRGQMALVRGMPHVLKHIINEGRRYLVPRGDGRILAGSTEENAGYDRRTTADGIRGLLDLAVRLVPRLATFEIERTWAGLRPATADGLPYLGPLPGLTNAFVAAGHFRSGLHLSPGTARVMSEAIQSKPPLIDLRAFRIDRS